MATSDELLKQMYDSNLASQKAALQSDYDAALADLDAQKAAAQKQTEHNVRLTKTEADRSAVNAAEYYEAAGLSSGAKAQARVAQDNQLLADLTAIRAAQQQGDIDIERQRGLLGKQFAAAIRQAQAENDMAKAQALYEQAKEAEANLLAQQKEAAKAMASMGNFDLYAQLYGLTPEQKGALVQNFTNQQLQSDNSLIASDEAERKAGQAKLDQQYKDMLAFYKETAQYDKWEQLIQQGPPVYETQREKNARIEQETISALKAQFPSGSIYDRSLWASLMQQYGESWLSKNGFRFTATPHATTPGTGGRTQDVANINW